MRKRKLDIMKSFWSFSLGNVVTLLTYLVSFGIYVGTMNTKMKQQEFMLRENQIKVEALTIEVGKLDREGSRAKDSQINNVSQFQSLDGRVTKLEEWIPRLAVMSDNIIQMKEMLKESVAAKK